MLAFQPDFVESLLIRHGLVGVVLQQLAARLVLVKSDQGMATVGNKQAIAQVGQRFRGFDDGHQVAVGSQHCHQFWGVVAEVDAVADGNADAASSAAVQKALQQGLAFCTVEFEQRQVGVVDAQAIRCRGEDDIHAALVVAPRAEKFSAHGV